MSPWEATADQLIAAGWGDAERQDIPADWQTRRPPARKVGRAAFESKLADFKSVLSDKEALRWKRKPPRLDSAHKSWRQRRALYILENAAGEVLEGR